MKIVVKILWFLLVYLSYGYIINVIIPKLKFNEFIKTILVFIASMFVLILVLLIFRGV